MIVDARVFQYVDRLLRRPEAREAAIWRRTGPETIFGEAKERHGLRRARFRGLEGHSRNLKEGVCRRKNRSQRDNVEIYGVGG
ncbi:MAG: Transposase IS4 family protein [Desulfotomaculum sp. 46_296]|nr:MAG: Transposase IS4 family protein [Desulfotomaculum sp. 46_296]HAG08465.1 hypothetical protein [Desulfotomaculum sp.]HAU32660.1 hypothetical protein [Desulfotomaculum sp.]